MIGPKSQPRWSAVELDLLEAAEYGDLQALADESGRTFEAVRARWYRLHREKRSPAEARRPEPERVDDETEDFAEQGVEIDGSLDVRRRYYALPRGGGVDLDEVSSVTTDSGRASPGKITIQMRGNGFIRSPILADPAAVSRSIFKAMAEGSYLYGEVAS